MENYLGDWMMALLIFLFGAVIGSFLNVCIYRIPKGLSLISPGSFCPSCGAHIPFYDNIPLLSYFLLFGRCRNCQARISLIYPFVELLNAILYLLFYFKVHLSGQFFFYAPFISALLVLFFIDRSQRILPDAITITGLLFGIGFSPFLDKPGIVDSLLGAIGGFLLFYIIAFIYEKATGKEGMGGGDIKMISMAGAFLGWKGMIATVFISSLMGTFFGLFLIIFFGKNLKDALPFGCFISMAGLAVLFLNDELTYYYLKLIRIYG